MLEEKGHVCGYTSVPNRPHPAMGHGSTLGTTLAADNHPVDPRQIQGLDRGKQWLNGYALYHRWCLAEIPDPVEVARHFHRHAHPDIRWPRELGCQGAEALRALGEDDERVPVGLFHGGKDSLEKVQGDGPVKQIAHAGDKDALQRALQHALMCTDALQRAHKAVHADAGEPLQVVEGQPVMFEHLPYDVAVSSRGEVVAKVLVCGSAEDLLGGLFAPPV